jgi:hypothetical protein
MKRQSFGIALGYGFVIRGGFRNLSGDRRSRAIRAVRSLPLCKRCRTCEAPGVSTARAILWGSRPRGVEGQPQKSSMRRMTRSGLPPALRIAHRPRVAEASKNMAARVCSAVSKWRASTRCVASSPRVRREKKVTPRFFLLLCGAGGLKRDGVGCHNRLPHPHWHVASSVGRAATSSPIAGDREVRRARRLKPAAAHCITFADVTSRRRG